MLSQFSSDGSNNQTLRSLDLPKTVHPIGRLDADTEGLLLLTDEPGWENKLLHPKQHCQKTYWVQIEGLMSNRQIKHLETGVEIKGYRTKPCQVSAIENPEDLPLRDPPIRFRKNSPTSWLEISIREGRNRQVRRMTAAVGHPALRIIRIRIGAYRLTSLNPGSWGVLDTNDRSNLLK